jgi:hypothetical protein
MIGTSYLQNARNVVLYASYPSSLPQHLCDRKLHSAVGGLPEPDLVKYKQWFDAFPKRIETFSILNNWGCQHLVRFWVTLILVRGLWCRTLRVRHAGGERELTARALSAGLASAVLLFASGHLLCGVTVVATWAVALGLVPDILATLVVFSLASNARLLAALGLSVAYATWAALRLDVHWAEIRKLPNYMKFRANLRPVEQTSKHGHTGKADEPEDERGCPVCWSSDGPPQQLPCKGKHRICLKCIDRLHAAPRNQCPFCRLPLYRDDASRTALYELIVACHGATTTFNVIGIALKLYLGSYISAAIDVCVILPMRRVTWKALIPARLADDSPIEELQLWVLVSVIVLCWTGYWTGTWDQATFVDGKLVRGLWIGTKYQFVWDG